MKRSKVFSTVLCCALISAMLVPRQVRAQSGEDLVKGLLRGLIESQLEKSKRKERLSDPFRGSDNVRLVAPTPEMQKLRPIAAGFSQESAALAALLNTDAGRDRSLRQHLANAIELQATATALSQRCATEANHLVMIENYRGLNSDWTGLTHQLEQNRSISNQTRQCIARLDKLDQQYCSILGIQPQLSNAQLTREAYSLDAHLHDLIDDVNARIYRQNSHQVLQQNLGRHHHEADFFAQQVAAGMPYETVVRQYQKLYTDWEAMQGDLKTVSGQAVARDIRHIEESHQTFHSLLGLEVRLNKDILLHLVHETTHEMSELLKLVTLEQLMTVPDAGLVPDAASAFDGTMQNLDSVLHLDENRQAIGEAWVYADDAWQVLSFYLAPLPNPQARTLLGSVSQNLKTLQRTIGVTIEFDRDALFRSASALEDTAGHLLTTINNWQTHPGNHNRNLPTLTQRLINQCHSLEQSLADRRRTPAHSRQQCDAVIATWQQIRPELNKCDTDERPTINYIVGKFTPDLIRLRTMLGE